MQKRFPRLEQEIEESLIRFIAGYGNSIADQIGSSCYFEGSTSSIIREGDEREETVMHKLSSELEVISKVVLYGPVDAIVEPYRAIGRDLSEQKERTLLDAVSSATEKVGNVVSAGGKPFSFEILLEVLEKIWIDFDENGDPIMPTLVAGEAVVRQITSLEEDFSKKEQINKLLQRKKVEWLAREANRTLVG